MFWCKYFTLDSGFQDTIVSNSQWKLCCMIENIDLYVTKKQCI